MWCPSGTPSNLSILACGLIRFDAFCATAISSQIEICILCVRVNGKQSWKKVKIKSFVKMSVNFFPFHPQSFSNQSFIFIQTTRKKNRLFFILVTPLALNIAKRADQSLPLLRIRLLLPSNARVSSLHPTSSSSIKRYPPLPMKRLKSRQRSTGAKWKLRKFGGIDEMVFCRWLNLSAS